jgi:predicted DNA-binding ArsR family transcriptional regulator
MGLQIKERQCFLVLLRAATSSKIQKLDSNLQNLVFELTSIDQMATVSIDNIRDLSARLKRKVTDFQVVFLPAFTETLMRVTHHICTKSLLIWILSRTWEIAL